MTRPSCIVVCIVVLRSCSCCCCCCLVFFSCCCSCCCYWCRCPRLRLRAFSDYTYTREVLYPHPGSYIARTDYGVTNDGWMTISGAFTATTEDERVQSSSPSLSFVHHSSFIVIHLSSSSPSCSYHGVLLLFRVVLHCCCCCCFTLLLVLFLSMRLLCRSSIQPFVHYSCRLM